jgi:hypothetical protein
MDRALTRIALFGLIGLLFRGIASADDPPASVKSSHAQLEVRETEFDFGHMQQRVQVAHRYWMKSVGGQPLRIEDVQPGCGCTKAPLEKRDVAVGDSTFVDLIFSSGHYDGHTHKSARVICNVPGRAPELFFDAYPLKFPDTLHVFTVSPAELQLDDLRTANDSAVRSQKITVRNVSNSALAFALADRPTVGGLRLTLPSDEIAPGDSIDVRVDLDADILDQIMTRSLTIEATDASRTRFTVAIRKATRWGPLPLAVE